MVVDEGSCEAVMIQRVVEESGVVIKSEAVGGGSSSHSDVSLEHELSSDLGFEKSPSLGRHDLLPDLLLLQLALDHRSCLCLLCCC